MCQRFSSTIPSFFEQSVVVLWILSWGGLLSYLTGVDGEEKVMLCPSVQAHTIFCHNARPLSWFQTPSLLPAVLIAWPTYDCDAHDPHDSLQRASIWHSMTKTLFSPLNLPAPNKRPGHLSQCHVYKGTEEVVTNWSRSWQHCVYVLFPLPACVSLEPYSRNCLVCSITIVALQDVCCRQASHSRK